jgi:hypothetical protein
MSVGKRPPPGPPIPPRPATRSSRTVDPVVASYKDRVADRAKAHGDERRTPVPDIAAAARDYRPEKEGPMTLAMIGEAQGNIKKMNDGEEKKSILSPGTIAGLHAIHEATVAQQKQAQPTVSPTGPTEPAPAPAPEPSKVNKEREASRASTEISDLDFDLALSRMRSDTINNEKEREAVKSRVQPMDLADGLVTGEFKQSVPVVPGKLVIVYRSITPMENEEIRRHVLEEALKDERFAEIQAERYGFMQVVASVVSVNGQEMPKHLRSAGFSRTFDWDVFNKKVGLFSGYPAALIAAISTHSAWFDVRVRELFATANLKNG